jgi:hypothetical protein
LLEDWKITLFHRHAFPRCFLVYPRKSDRSIKEFTLTA